MDRPWGCRSRIAAPTKKLQRNEPRNPTTRRHDRLGNHARSHRRAIGRKPQAHNKMPSKKTTPAKKKNHPVAAAASCSAGWLPPETAPLDGTPILGDFGWPWANFGLWDEYDEQWCIATLQASPMADGPTNSWIETDTEKRGSLKRWMPLPPLPNASALAPPPQRLASKKDVPGG